jgi:hypothetical protein
MTGMVAAFIVHLSMLYLPWGQALLGTEPVDGETWLLLIACALSVLVVMELHKLFQKHIRI